MAVDECSSLRMRRVGRMTATDLVVTPDMVRAVAGLVFDTALPASIAHELNGMADQLELEQRDVAGEDGPVLSGGPADIKRQLDAMPLGSVVATPLDSGELPLVWSKLRDDFEWQWWASGQSLGEKSEAVAKSGSLEVLR